MWLRHGTQVKARFQHRSKILWLFYRVYVEVNVRLSAKAYIVLARAKGGDYRVRIDVIVYITSNMLCTCIRILVENASLYIVKCSIYECRIAIFSSVCYGQFLVAEMNLDSL